MCSFVIHLKAFQYAYYKSLSSLARPKSAFLKGNLGYVLSYLRTKHILDMWKKIAKTARDGQMQTNQI